MKEPLHPNDESRRWGKPTADRREPAADGSGRPPLELTVVEYTDRSDRVTMAPPDLSGIARMETWLSADSAAIVDLAAWR
jgi:hypothetical protein